MYARSFVLLLKHLSQLDNIISHIQDIECLFAILLSRRDISGHTRGNGHALFPFIHAHSNNALLPRIVVLPVIPPVYLRNERSFLDHPVLRMAVQTRRLWPASDRRWCVVRDECN